MKHFKLFNNETNYNAWLTSDNFVTPYVSKIKSNGNINYQRRLPYDNEIEYLQSTGTQYIDLLFKPSNNKVTVKTNLCITEKQDSTILGTVSDESNILRFYPIGFSNDKFYTCNFSGKWDSEYSQNSNSITYNTYYNVESTISNNNVILKVNQTVWTKNISEGFDESKSLFLFARNESTVGHFAKCKLKYMEIYESDILIMNLIPVRIEHVGYMYDKISNQLFSNQGTGNFILGPDK